MGKEIFTFNDIEIEKKNFTASNVFAVKVSQC